MKHRSLGDNSGADQTRAGQKDMRFADPRDVEFMQKIAAGGTADVWLARPKGGGGAFIVKYSQDAAVGNDYIYGQFEREWEAFQFLDAAGQSHIMPKIISFDVDDIGHAYLYEEYFDGIGLNEIFEMRMPYRAMRVILDRIVSAMTAFHRCGIVHRDIKPSNILVARRAPAADWLPIDASPQALCARRCGIAAAFCDPDEADRGGAAVRFIDFSFALIGGKPHPTQAGNCVCGTPAYCAPEQARGNLATDLSDWYALGVSVYEWITGRRPFCDADPGALLRMHADQCPPPPINRYIADLPDDLLTIVMLLLEKIPEKRKMGIERLQELLKRA